MITANVRRLCREHDISIFALENVTGIGNGCTNIYQNARKAAGLTQERAAELLGLSLSLRSLADYESGLRVPPNDVADRMATVYNSQLLAVQHLRAAAEQARDKVSQDTGRRAPRVDV